MKTAMRGASLSLVLLAPESRAISGGAKRIPCTSIRDVERLPLTGANKVRRWRIRGSGDFRHWWNLDAQRPGKDLAVVIDVGHHVRPTITPDDPDAVERILAGRITAQ